MLKVRTTPTFAATIDISLATDKPGRTNDGSFDCQYKYVDKERYAEILDQLRQLVAGGDVSAGAVIRYKSEALGEVLTCVKGLVDDETGQPFEPEEQMQLVLGQLPLLNGAFDGFIANYAGAAAKNSKRSPRP